MGNSKAGLGMGHFLVNLKNKEDVGASLYALIDSDNDLTENEEYFQDDTLELGYECEASRMVDEALKELGHPTTAEEFEAVANKVFESISDQEYYCACELSVVKVSKTKISVAFAYGGNYSN